MKKPDMKRLRHAAVKMANALQVNGGSATKFVTFIGDDTLFGNKKGWESYIEQIITAEELRNLVIARFQSFLEREFGASDPKMTYLTPELEEQFDKALFGRPALDSFKAKLKNVLTKAAYTPHETPETEIELSGTEWGMAHADAHERSWFYGFAADPDCPHRFFFMDVLDEFIEAFTEQYQGQYTLTFHSLVKPNDEGAIEHDDIASVNDLVSKANQSDDEAIRYFYFRVLRRLKKGQK